MDFQQPLALEASLPLGAAGSSNRYAHLDSSRSVLFTRVLSVVKSEVETY